MDLFPRTNGAIRRIFDINLEQSSQFEKQKQHDLMKKSYAEGLGVPLIEIPYTADTYDDVKGILEHAGIRAKK